MYRLIALIFFVMCSSAYSQLSDNWKWLNPKPQGNSMNKIDFVDNNTGYAAGAFGTMLKTVNNGLDWTKLNTGTSNAFLSVDFINENTGYTGGIKQMLKKTIDGGNNWTALQLPVQGQFDSLFYILDINFINENTGYVLGFFQLESKIWKTTDGGNSWSTQTTAGANYLNNLYFLDANNGYGSGGAFTGEIIKTTNGGANWQLVYNDNYAVNSMTFLNASTGFVGCDEGRIYKTTDGGYSWNFALSDAGIDITSLHFLNASTGIGFGTGSVYVKSTDGGNNWYESMPVGSSMSSQYLTSSVTPGGTIHAAGTYGAMIRSTDAGNTFLYEQTVTDGYVSDIEFINTSTGYAVTGFNQGDILKTTDAGESWVSQISSYTLSIYGISFTGDETGYLAGSLKIYKTSNGGTNWQTIYTSNTNEIFTDVFFTNQNTGYVTGSYGKLLKTTNAGLNWTASVIPNAGTLLSSVYFVNDNTGFAVGDNNAAVKTTNAGVNWTSMSVASPFINLGNVHFTDLNDGYISAANGIYKTTNSGGSWFALPTPSGGYNSVQFRGSFGYAVGGEGKIIKSSDAGASWIVQPTVTDNGLSALYFNSDNYVYAGGLLGTLMKTIPTELIALSNFQLDLTFLIQGFYDAAGNSMVMDTATVYLRNTSSPYNKIDSAKSYISSNGSGTFIFENASDNVNYYLQIHHRNSLETWSSAGQSFSNSQMTYDFSTASAKAFGNNMIQADASPVKFAVYSGDVNQDGVTDLSDLSITDNDAYNFATGYLNSDLNGDNIIDLADLGLVDNNAFNFVSVQRP